MILKHLLPLLLTLIPIPILLHGANTDVITGRKRASILDHTVVTTSWARQYYKDQDYDKSYQLFTEVIQKGREDLISELAFVSLKRHLTALIENYQTPRLYFSIYHQDGSEHLIQIFSWYESHSQKGCSLCCVNLGNIARFEGNRQEALDQYNRIIASKKDLTSLNKFALFTIGYPLIHDQEKYPSAMQLLVDAHQKNNFYVQEFKKTYWSSYEEASAILAQWSAQHTSNKR